MTETTIARYAELPDLCRMTIDEEGGHHPVRLAEAIHRQLSPSGMPVDVEAVARALDIDEIVSKPLTNFEGALLTDADRSRGKVLINAAANAQRRRFTLGHELLHFLNDRHIVTGKGFHCTKKDLGSWSNQSSAFETMTHQRQEREANRFAIELLAPRTACLPMLGKFPDLDQILEIARCLDISKEAAARRMVDLSDARVAVVFTKGGSVRYVDAGEYFPKVAAQSGMTLPRLDLRPRSNGTTEPEEIEPDPWLQVPKSWSLVGQRLRQQNGFGMLLLTAERRSSGHRSYDEDDDLDQPDTVDAFPRWGD